MRWSTCVDNSRQALLYHHPIILHYLSHRLFGRQDLLRSHALLESEDRAPSGGDREQRRKRFTERKRLHQLKRDHEQQEGSKRKVLRLDEGQDGGLSSGSDTEERGKGRKSKEGQEQDVDIQVSSENYKNMPQLFFFYTTALRCLRWKFASLCKTCKIFSLLWFKTGSEV